MPTDHRAELQKIRTFPSLIRYLRDEMGWPIDQNSFDDVDDLFYDFTPEELGIEAKTAAKIETIKRLRPLSPQQPWGIFFVKFQPGRLPVIALRRILSQVALKKRASANNAERVAWSVNDLLFVSNYGEGDHRQISFAHFSQAEARQDLPTLRVLGWDNLDTALHLDAVARELTENLAWPEDHADTEGWRDRWRAAFTLRHREVVTTSKELSIRLAELARAIRDRINTALAIETYTGPLTKLMKAFQEALVHDLDADGFADMYAQTIAYGLLSARIADPEKKTADDFAAHMRTNPFLRELMETFLKVGGRRGKAGGPGIDFDELGVSEVVELLDDANMEAVVRDFGDRNPQEDPVIHFYELFLKEYDAKKRIQRGVFYTPRPVVSYIVRSVDELLRTEFGLADGLADTTTWGEVAKRHNDLKIPEGVPLDQDFVQILDPATGTGTFLVEVIDLIHKTLVAKWQAQGHGEKKIEVLWNEYVPNHLLPRLHGYELLMAPYAIAHLKIGLKLYETGYHFGSEERARIYLTNALEPAHDFSGTFEFAIPALAHEAQAVNTVKRHRRFTVVIGNPPYSSAAGAASSAFLTNLMKPFTKGLGVESERKKGALQDDYIRFLALCRHLASLTGVGILGLITNSSYIDGTLHRAMRKSLLESFARLEIVNLHGSSRAGYENVKDENVFDIMQGVAIVTGAAGATPLQPNGSSFTPAILYAEILGTRSQKYEALSHRTVDTCGLAPTPPYYLLRPLDGSLFSEYERFLSVKDAFAILSSGIETEKDHFAVDFDADVLVNRLQYFCDMAIPLAKVSSHFQLKSTPNWDMNESRKALSREGLNKDLVIRYLYRCFDWRYTYYSDWIVTRGRRPVMRHMLLDNLAIVCLRQVKGEPWAHVFVSSDVTNKFTLSSKSSNVSYHLPLFLRDDNSENPTLVERSSYQTNLRPEVLRQIAVVTGAPIADSHDARSFARLVFFYIYAVLHSPAYRFRYSEYLRLGFPRFPMPSTGDLFAELSELGGELVALHLMESPKLDRFITTYIGPQNPEIGRVGWSDDTVWLYAAATKKGQPATPGTIGFRGVPEAVWNFHIGGYQVCEKWLKDRKGRTLSDNDITHYQKIVVALTETIRLMQEIDEIIEQHGGWPGAFAQGEATPQEPVSEAAGSGSAMPLSAPTTALPLSKADLLPLSRAAEPEAPPYEAAAAGEQGVARRKPDELDREELICRIRQMFSDGENRERAAAIGALAGDLGHKHPDRRIREDLDAALHIAVGRGILATHSSGLRLNARNIDQYERSFLKEQFLASLSGRPWIERDDAIRGFARWMGFRRTGRSIDDTARSLISGLVREKHVERDGSRIRSTQ